MNKSELRVELLDAMYEYYSNSCSSDEVAKILNIDESHDNYLLIEDLFISSNNVIDRIYEELGATEDSPDSEVFGIADGIIELLK